MTPSDQVRQAVESRVGHMRMDDKARLVAETHRFLAQGHKLEDLTILFEGGAHIGLVESLAKPPVRPAASAPEAVSHTKPPRKRGRPAKAKAEAKEPEVAETAAT